MTKPARLLRSLEIAIPLLLLPAIVFEARIAWLAIHEPFGRDQGIFQYVAWALEKGQRDYRDLHEMNGPFVHLVTLVLYKIGGRDELVIRVVDFLTSAVVFFGAGAVLPGVGWTKGDAPARPSWRRRVAWGLAASVLLWANYLKYNWWDHTQRESLYDLFVVGALSLQLLGQIPSQLADRRRLALIAAAGALGVMPSWGKPTCVLYLLGQIACLWLDDEAPLTRRARVRAFLIGCAAGSLPIVAFVLVYADVGAMLHLVLLDGPRFYRWIWHRSVLDGWNWGNAARLNYGLFTALALPLLVALRLLPRRAWGAGFFVLAALANFYLQAKLFPYHLHPVTCSAFLVWGIVLCVLAERAPRGLVRWIPAKVVTAVGALGAALLCFHCIEEVRLSQTAQEMTPDRLAAARSFEARENELPKFYNGGSTPGGVVGGDYYPLDMRQAAAFLQKRTSPDDRVQTWGVDPYVLFLAQRLSATPYLYSFEINVDAAVAGGSGGKPSASQVAWLRRWSRDQAHEMFELVAKRPPAAFVLFDNQPFDHPSDADADFVAHCPEAGAFMKAHYTRVRRFGAVRVWLRNDLAAQGT
jgi:hypothetical protein